MTYSEMVTKIKDILEEAHHPKDEDGRLDIFTDEVASGVTGREEFVLKIVRSDGRV